MARLGRGGSARAVAAARQWRRLTGWKDVYGQNHTTGIGGELTGDAKATAAAASGDG
uniref:Uncharacterized protein P0587F01.15 n=1 Tax=Oryza sativa subsp. japonica TaxID=39947 RepID=C1AR06_ORYSJ|nr:hypothetical protein [Oryza sativa Japonica Group]